MKQKIIGNYVLGCEAVEIVAMEGQGAEFYFCPEKGHCARIKVGFDESDWGRVVAYLLHEAMEMSVDRMHGRYRATRDRAGMHDNYLFAFNHGQLTVACDDVAHLMADCLPDLADAWRKWNVKK